MNQHDKKDYGEQAFSADYRSGSRLVAAGGSSPPAGEPGDSEVVSKKGIEAWLVEDHSRPILSLQFGFAGGTVDDPEGKPGVATFVAGMLDEGAGDLDPRPFRVAGRPRGQDDH